MKKIRPLKILQKFGNNAYEVELHFNLGISPIFNMCDLFCYRGTIDTTQRTLLDLEGADWVQDFPTSQLFQLDIILDYKVIKKNIKVT